MTSTLRQALAALDTAEGVCQLVADDIKPSDLDECLDEIRAAQQAIEHVLGMTS